MLRKIDRWIGRHMSAKRWTVFWFAIELGSVIGMIALAPSWWLVAFLPSAAIGALMCQANARRMK